MSGNLRYTRWVNEEPNDEELIENRADIPLEENAELYEDDDSMQEGRRALAMMTHSRRNSQSLSRIGSARVMCILILTFIVIFVIGTLIGYSMGHNNVSSSASKSSEVKPCPTFPPIPSTTSPRTTTTTTKPVEELDSMAMHFLSHLSPSVLNMYIRNLSSLDADQVRSYVQNTFSRKGFKVDSWMFPIMTSVPDQYSPNTVEIVRQDGSSRIINKATKSLQGFFPYSGFSPNGTASAPLIYAHYGSDEDFEVLRSSNISVRGRIALIRLGRSHPGVQVRNAEKRGAVGVILYPDSFDYGGGTPSSPTTMGLPSDGVVWQNLRIIPGDPSTPSYSSRRYIFRIPSSNYSGVPSIPVQPVNSDTGRFLLHILDGPPMPSNWTKSLRPGTSYTVGGTFKGNVTQVRLTTRNVVENRDQNVLMAHMQAKDHDKVLHVGCHYELSGNKLTSSGVGLASLLALADALKTTYPNGTERLVVFTAFESKYGDTTVGTEYAQLFSWWLESSALAYIDLDTVFSGPGFMEAHVSPILEELVQESFQHVDWVGKEAVNVYQGIHNAQPFRFDPVANKTDLGMQESFSFAKPYECDESINYVSLLGIPAIHLAAVNINKSASYNLLNSQYDTMDALLKQEKSLLWTHMIVSLLGVTALSMSMTPLPPLRFEKVGWDLKNAWEDFRTENLDQLRKAPPLVMSLSDDITSAMNTFVMACNHYDSWYKEAADSEITPSQNFRRIETRMNKFLNFGRRFLRPRNVKGHSDFSSLVTFGPSLDDPCKGQYFPVLRKTLKEAIAGLGPWDAFQEELSLVISVLHDFRTEP